MEWRPDLRALADAAQQLLEDVLALLRSERMDWSRLLEYFEAILPKMGELSLRQDPVEFEQNFRALERTWSAGR